MSNSQQPSNSAHLPATWREDQAKLEIGHTEIGPTAKWMLVMVFLVTILAVPAIQTGREWLDNRADSAERPWLQAVEIFRAFPAATDAWRQTDGGFTHCIMWANAVLLRGIQDYENELERVSFLREQILPPVQLLLARTGAGNEKGYIGREDWLFYRPAIDLITGPGFLDRTTLTRRASGGNEWQPPPTPDPRPAILDFHAQLAERGIQLVLMPTPVKSMIHPEMFYQHKGLGEVVALNHSQEVFLREMEEGGVLVFDPSATMMTAKLAEEDGHASPSPQFLATDTHWRPEAMDRVAADLSHFLNTQFDLPSSQTRHLREPMQVSAIGDIAGMLQLSPEQQLFLPELVTLQQVRSANQELWSPAPESDVLLLGDSFANIYSLEGMNWGESAGLAEQVSFHLNRTLDTILRNDAGAFATRQILAAELARGRDRLAGKRVVIWQFAARELSVGDWKLIQLPEPPSRTSASSPVKAPDPAGGDWIATVSGEIAQASEVPGTDVPYKDHIRSLHLTGLEAKLGTAEEPDAVVYVWDMRDRKLTPEARLRPGDRVTLRMRSWDEVSDTLGRINRSELDDPDLMLRLPWWGERVKE